MPKPLRYTGDWPPPEVLHEYPNWVCAWDEEDEEGQDETTLKPEDEQTLITPDTIHTAGEVQLADGRSFPAIISLPTGQPESFDYYDGTAWRRCRQDYQTKRWIPFEQSTLPLRLSTRLTSGETGETWRLEIRSDGSAVSWT